ncbi:MAG: hypothetical protein PHW64_05160 [Sulfuricurvum sp.]|nr:hypothetical protein [Sulfuricurvum sp.]
MKYGKYSAAAAVALALVGGIGMVGCNEGTSNASAPSGTVVMTASLPSGGVSKSLIDENTGTIEVKLYSGKYQYGGPQPVLVADVNITRTSPTATIAKVPVGDFYAQIISYDSNGSELDHMHLAGTIVEGTNTLNATFVRGKWTLDTPITLNKTLSTDTARIDSISVVPNAEIYNTTSMGKAAFDYNSPLGYTSLPVMVNGANLPKVVYSGYNQKTYNEEYNVTSTTETRVGGYITYMNQFKGPNTNTNALQSDEMLLKPVSGNVISDDLNNTRSLFVLGVDPAQQESMYQEPGYESNSTFSQDVAMYATTKVTAYNKISGNIIEVNTLSNSYTRKCYDGNATTTQVTCPWDQQLFAAKARQKAVVKGMNTKRAKLGKSAVGTDGCYRNLTSTDSSRYLGSVWDQNTSTSRPITVVETTVWAGDACVHPFTATGTQLPSTDMNLTIQKVR